MVAKARIATVFLGAFYVMHMVPKRPATVILVGVARASLVGTTQKECFYVSHITQQTQEKRVLVFMGYFVCHINCLKNDCNSYWSPNCLGLMGGCYTHRIASM